MGPENVSLKLLFLSIFLGLATASSRSCSWQMNVNAPAGVSGPPPTDQAHGTMNSSRNSTNAEKDLDSLQTLDWLSSANSFADPCRTMELYATFRNIFIEHCGHRAIWDRTLTLSADHSNIEEKDIVVNILVHEFLGDKFNTSMDLRSDLNSSDCFTRMRRIALRLLPPNHTWSNSLKRLPRSKSPLIWLQKLDNLYLKKNTITSSHIKRQYVSFRYKLSNHMTSFIQEFDRRADLYSS